MDVAGVDLGETGPRTTGMDRCTVVMCRSQDLLDLSVWLQEDPGAEVDADLHVVVGRRTVPEGWEEEEEGDKRKDRKRRSRRGPGQGC